MTKTPWLSAGKLARSVWLGSGIEFQLLPLIGWVFCLELLVNVSLRSETSVLESAELGSRSNSFHDYRNKTPLKLSYSIQVIITEENEWANYGEAVHVFAWPPMRGEVERPTERGREKERGFMCCLWKENLLRVLNWLPRARRNASLHAAKSEMLSFFLWHHISIILSRLWR